MEFHIIGSFGTLTECIGNSDLKVSNFKHIMLKLLLCFNNVYFVQILFQIPTQPPPHTPFSRWRRIWRPITNQPFGLQSFIKKEKLRG